jgi:hypothetical protein
MKSALEKFISCCWCLQQRRIFGVEEREAEFTMVPWCLIRAQNSRSPSIWLLPPARARARARFHHPEE